jgi:hypothetical protein
VIPTSRELCGFGERLLNDFDRALHRGGIRPDLEALWRNVHGNGLSLAPCSSGGRAIRNGSAAIVANVIHFQRPNACIGGGAALGPLKFRRLDIHRCSAMKGISATTMVVASAAALP